MAQFKVGDKVRLVKALEDYENYNETGFNNSWMPEMTERVENKDEGIIEHIGRAGIRIEGQ